MSLVEHEFSDKDRHMRIVELCRGPYGRLSERRRTMLEQLLERPDRLRWERARGLIIRDAPLITLEMAVRSVRRNHTSLDAPDPFTLYRALRQAVDE
jgi:hypothetical protein